VSTLMCSLAVLVKSVAESPGIPAVSECGAALFSELAVDVTIRWRSPSILPDLGTFKATP